MSFTPTFGDTMRVTRLLADGSVPTVGTTNAVMVTKGFVNITASANTADGQSKTCTRADGQVEEDTAPTSLTSYGVDIGFCSWIPEILDIISNATVYPSPDGANLGVILKAGAMTKLFALEWWTMTRTPGVYAYTVLPLVRSGIATPGELSPTSSDYWTPPVTGIVTRSGNRWGVGPYNVQYDNETPPVEVPLLTALDPDTDPWLSFPTALAPPDPTTTFIPMPDPAGP